MKFFLTPEQYNKIYSEKSGILITSKIDKRIDYLQAENKKLREALEKIVDQYFDLPYELRMKQGLKEGRDSLIAREALKEVEE
jgi:hypothetical protein